MYNILICDDEPDIVSALKIYLASDGYGIYEAYNGREAIEMMQKTEIHLVLMDIMMPEMDGIQTMFTTGNLLAFIAFMVVVLIASILVGVICKRLTAGVTVFCVGAVVLFILFRLRPAWLLTAFNAVLSALALFDPFQDIVGGMFSIPAIVYYLSVIGLFLFLTGQALERRRWN